MGVRGITLRAEDDKVIGMVCVDRTMENKPEIMVVSENGYGKRTFLDDPETGEAVYRLTNRGGKGVITLNTTDKTGKLISISSVTDDDDLMIINRSGITIRISLLQLRVMGRNTQGVKLINLKNNDKIAAVSKVERSPEDEEIENLDIDAEVDGAEITESEEMGIDPKDDVEDTTESEENSTES
jgi:DNA gyrase subunit A